LTRNLDAIVRQEYSNYEVIITDDSKNDDIKTLVLAAEIADKQNNIKLAESYRNRIRKIYPGYFNK